MYRKCKCIVIGVCLTLAFGLVAGACSSPTPKVRENGLYKNILLTVTPNSSSEAVSSLPSSSEESSSSSPESSEPEASSKPPESKVEVNTKPVTMTNDDIKKATQQKPTQEEKEEDPGKGKPPQKDPEPPAPPPPSSTPESTPPSSVPGSSTPESSAPGSSSSGGSSSEASSETPVSDGWHYDSAGKKYFYVDGKPSIGWKSISTNGFNRRYLFDQSGVLLSRSGIDVSFWQGTNVNFRSIKADGIDFVILRVGYRGYGSGKLVIDECFEQYYRDAKAAGLSVGMYFFSQAITEQEAVDEAKFCLELAKSRNITEPIFFDPEFAYENGQTAGRLYEANLSRQKRTDVDIAFCNTIQSAGYKTGVYTNWDWAKNRRQMNRLSPYQLWYARYIESEVSLQETGLLASFWQYSSTGRVAGISGNVDMNVSF